eukprot:IDg21985t1
MWMRPLDEIPNDAPRGSGRSRKKPVKPVGVKDEYVLVISVMCINTTVGPEGREAFIPNSPQTTLEYGDKVLVYRDTTNQWDPRKLTRQRRAAIFHKQGKRAQGRIVSSEVRPLWHEKKIQRKPIAEDEKDKLNQPDLLSERARNLMEASAPEDNGVNL